MNNPSTEHPFYGEVISVYTRAQAQADGALIDAGSMARVRLASAGLLP